MDDQTQAVMESADAVDVRTTKKTIIVFSGDFDKMMAAFIIANGAAAMGDDVTMFFTFWGLNALRKAEKVQVDKKKSALQAMFGKMMPRGANKLGLSLDEKPEKPVTKAHWQWLFPWFVKGSSG